MIPDKDAESFSDFTTNLLSRAEETRQSELVRTFRSQQGQQLRCNASHVDLQYNGGDKVLLWTLVQKPGRSKNRLEEVRRTRLNN